MSNEFTIEYADLVASMYLCAYFNPDNNTALKRTVKRVKKRMRTPDMKNMCKGLILTRKPLTTWLTKLENNIYSQGLTLSQFLRVARTDLSN